MSEISTGSNAADDSHDAPGPMLWIAEDGTTYTSWIPFRVYSSEAPIMKRHTGRRKKRLLEQPFVLFETADTAPNHTELEEHSKSRNLPALDLVVRQTPSQATLWCDVCNMCFYSAAELKTHQITHREETLLRCEDCAEVFNVKSALEKHKAKEHGKLRYPCEVCGLQYNYRSQYIIHQRTHTGEKPFCCKECGQAFGHKCSLLIHMRKHSGSSLFECGRCGKLLDTGQALEKHRKLRFCVNCKKCFTRRALRRHLKTHAQDEMAKKD